jgi:TetR/AcrR family transcriptional repressor of nem operon
MSSAITGEGNPMRVSKEKAARNREQILSSAARLFRENGIDATGVDSITEAVGLTHGGLYSHFDSKQTMAAEAVRFALARSRRRWRRTAESKARDEAFAVIAGDYLSREHRDARGNGCLVAALSCEIARQPPAVRRAFTQELKGVLEFLSHLMPDGIVARRREDAIAMFACMVGALILARAVNDEALSRRILKAAEKRLDKVATGRRPVTRRASATRVRASA